MTIGEWLATREAAPPAPLLAGVLDALGPAAGSDAQHAADRCLDAAERVVAGLLRDGRTGRDAAPELLAADALVTYAFEAASDLPARLPDRARAAMTRLARLGAPGSVERPAFGSAADPPS